MSLSLPQENSIPSGSFVVAPPRTKSELSDRSNIEPRNSSISLSELVQTFEQYGTIYAELSKLCVRLGIVFNQSDVEEAFTRIHDLFLECQRTAESERLQRLESLKYCQQLKNDLDKAIKSRVDAESSLKEYKEEMSRQSELITKLETNYREVQAQMQRLEERLLRELNEEKRNRTTVQKAHSAAEDKAAHSELARKQAEIAYHEALVASDQQRLLHTQSDHENLELKAKISALEQRKTEVEAKYEELLRACAAAHVQGDDRLNALLAEEGSKQSLHRDPASSSLHVLAPSEEPSLDTNLTWNQPIPPNKQPKDFSRSLMLPSSRTGEFISAHHCPAATQGGFDGISYRRPLPAARSSLPHSVVSGPAFLTNNIRPRNRQSFLAGWSPVSDLTMTSESSDSATAEDLTLDGLSNSRRVARLNSYDFGGSSSVPTTEYDSVIGSPRRNHIQVNPLLWAWQRKGSLIGRVKSEVSNVAKGGLRLSKSIWTWAVIAAATASIGLKNEMDSISDIFSESESEMGDHEPTRATTFVG